MRCILCPTSTPDKKQPARRAAHICGSNHPVCLGTVSTDYINYDCEVPLDLCYITMDTVSEVSGSVARVGGRVARFKVHRWEISDEGWAHYTSLVREKVPTQVRPGLVGMRLYAMEHVKRGCILVEYRGERIDRGTADSRAATYVAQEIRDFLLTEYILTATRDLVIDATARGNRRWYVHHHAVRTPAMF